MMTNSCLKCKKTAYETNFILIRQKPFTLCNDCIRERYKDLYNVFKINYPEHFEFKKFIHIKKIQNWGFTQVDIFKLINFLDYYLPSFSIKLDILDENEESPLLKRIIKEHNIFETNLLQRIVDIKPIIPKKRRKSNHPGIYLTNKRYQTYASINRRQLYVGCFNSIEEATLKKIEFIEKYNNGSNED